MVFDFSHEEVKRAVVLSYRLCFLHSSRCMRLFVPSNNECMITKEKEKKDQEIAYEPSLLHLGD